MPKVSKQNCAECKEQGPPGHIPVKHEPGTEIVMLSPADELRKTEAAMSKNMQAMQAR